MIFHALPIGPLLCTDNCGLQCDNALQSVIPDLARSVPVRLHQHGKRAFTGHPVAGPSTALSPVGALLLAGCFLLAARSLFCLGPWRLNAQSRLAPPYQAARRWWLLLLAELRVPGANQSIASFQWQA